MRGALERLDQLRVSVVLKRARRRGGASEQQHHQHFDLVARNESNHKKEFRCRVSSPLSIGSRRLISRVASALSHGKRRPGRSARAVSSEECVSGVTTKNPWKNPFQSSPLQPARVGAGARSTNWTLISSAPWCKVPGRPRASVPRLRLIV